MGPPGRPARTFEPFEPQHVDAAAALVADGVARLRARQPVLPDRWAATDGAVPTLRSLADGAEGLVVRRGGRIVGFHAAWDLVIRGERWAYSPDLGHAADPDMAAETVAALYAALAGRWFDAGMRTHVLTVLADDAPAIAALAPFGFGMVGVDLIRGVEPTGRAGPPDGVRIRRAGPADVVAVAALEDGLRRHLAAAPVFFVHEAPRSVDEHAVLLADPGTATFLAEAADRPIAYLRIGPSATDVAFIVRDAGTASISGAFTVPEMRREGVATALLDAALAWAREAGYVRCSVDHESANREAARFWGRTFEPVAVSYARTIVRSTG